MKPDSPLVLLVEDDEHLRGLLSMGVEEGGMRVHAEENANGAKAWLGKNVPTLILVDVMMPDCNGIDFCRWVRGHPKLAVIPIIVMSAIKDDETVQDALELGVADFIRKPFQLKQLYEKIKVALARRPPQASAP